MSWAISNKLKVSVEKWPQIKNYCASGWCSWKIWSVL